MSVPGCAVVEEIDLRGAIERVRADGVGRAALQRALEPGLRLLLRRRATTVSTETVICHVMDEVVAAIRDGGATTVEQVAHVARLALDVPAHICPGLQPNASNASAAESWMRQFTGRDFEALHAFYVGGRGIAQICDSLRMSRKEFDRVRERARAQAAVTVPPVG